MTVTLSRKDRLARRARAAKLYGIDGSVAVEVHEAYGALARGEIPRALELAFPVSKSHPRNKHPWIILGGAALAQREGGTAEAFFGQAANLAPGDATTLTGLAKAHVLKAEVEEAVAMAERAFAAGADDPGLAGIYLDFMSRLGRRLRAADHLAPVLRRIPDASLSLRMGDMLAEADEQGRAAEWLERAWKLDPGPEAHRLARLRGLVFSVRLDEAETLARRLMDEVADRDAVVIMLLTVLRVSGRPAEALELAETHRFSSPEPFAHSRGIVANLLQDLGRADEAEAAYLEGIHINGGSAQVSKALGVFRYRAGDYRGGVPLYAQRMPEVQRRRIPVDNAEPANLATLTRIHLMGEQGVGDQLALLPLIRHAKLADGTEKVFVADPRMGAALKGNTLGIRHVPQDDFIANPQQISPAELVYLGDLTRYLDGAPTGGRGGYLRPDPAKVGKLKARYAEMAAGRPVFGIAWRSNSLIGRLRSVQAAQLVQTLPKDAFAVCLQYGAVGPDIAEAAAARPDVTIFTDPDVDQMKDLAAFFAQIAALDTLVSIDNTTVHACGALGHKDCHVLIPGGSECMWYWGTEGTTDPWYGTLKLHRQHRPGDWTGAFDSLSAALARQPSLVSSR